MVDTDSFWGSIREEIRKNYIAIFERDWPTWLAGIFIALLALLIFLWQSPWGIAGGYRNWGDWFFYLAGFKDAAPDAPWINSMSVSA